MSNPSKRTIIAHKETAMNCNCLLRTLLYAGQVSETFQEAIESLSIQTTQAQKLSGVTLLKEREVLSFRVELKLPPRVFSCDSILFFFR